MLSTAVDLKKKNKRERLIAAALGLFLEKGPSSTSIDEIVQSAGVAKGTFYLYFKDRNEILDHIVARESAKVVRDAFVRARLRSPGSPAEEMLYAIEEVLERLSRRPELLALIHRNLSWGILVQTERASEEAGKDFLRLAQGKPAEDFAKLSFMVLELVSSVAYSSIVLGEPAGIDEMKPYLLDAVQRLLA
jgi:AcrR family transcriptional regulator